MKNPPILPAEDYSILKDALRFHVSTVEHHDWSVLVQYGANKETFERLQHELTNLKDALEKLGRLYEHQFKTP